MTSKIPSVAKIAKDMMAELVVKGIPFQGRAPDFSKVSAKQMRKPWLNIAGWTLTGNQTKALFYASPAYLKSVPDRGIARSYPSLVKKRLISIKDDGQPVLTPLGLVAIKLFGLLLEREKNSEN